MGRSNSRSLPLLAPRMETCPVKATPAGRVDLSGPLSDMCKLSRAKDHTLDLGERQIASVRAKDRALDLGSFR
jgi:hypothetical protein